MNKVESFNQIEMQRNFRKQLQTLLPREIPKQEMPISRIEFDATVAMSDFFSPDQFGTIHVPSVPHHIVKYGHQHYPTKSNGCPKCKKLETLIQKVRND